MEFLSNAITLKPFSSFAPLPAAQTVTTSSSKVVGPLAAEEAGDPFDEAPIDENKLKKLLQKQHSMNASPFQDSFVYLTDSNSNLIQYQTKPCSLDQLQLIESTKILRNNLNKTNLNGLRKANLPKVNSLSNLEAASNTKTATNDLIWL